MTETTPPAAPPAPAQLLSSAEAKLVTPELMSTFVAAFFDNLRDQLTNADLTEFFQLEFAEHADFQEPTAKRFIIGILSREKRTDNFVTVSRKYHRANPLYGSAAIALGSLYDDEQYVKMYDLELNCKMERTQLRVTLTPKFSTLQRIVLVITCAPSSKSAMYLRLLLSTCCTTLASTTTTVLRPFSAGTSSAGKRAQTA